MCKRCDIIYTFNKSLKIYNEHSGTDICVCKRQETLTWQALFEHFGSKHLEIVDLKAPVDQHI